MNVTILGCGAYGMALGTVLLENKINLNKEGFYERNKSICWKYFRSIIR